MAYRGFKPFGNPAEKKNGHGGARPGAGRKPKVANDNAAGAGEPSTTIVSVPAQPRQPMFSDASVQMILEAAREMRDRARGRPRTPEWNPFRIDHEKFGVAGSLIKKHHKALAMDAVPALAQANAVALQAWQAGGLLSNVVSEGLLFLGYPYLSELSQRPEYRLFGEIRAQEMVRKWTLIRGTDDESTKEKKRLKRRTADDDASNFMRQERGENGRTDARNKEIEAKIKELQDFERDLKIRDWFKVAATHDSYFGLGHMFLDFKGTNIEQLNDPELKTAVGTGRDETTLAKFEGQTGFFEGVRCIEPIWAYPTTYNAQNPLARSWYNPQEWFVMGTQVHKTRFLSFIGRPVPDILKPAYAFGGLAMTQMAQPYVDIWLRTRESVGEIIHAFSVMVLATNMATTTMPGGMGSGGGGDIMARLALFNIFRDNQGVFAIDKTTEDFKNVSAPLSGLDDLQAQAQEHLFSVGRIPAVKYAGIQPKGLNATSEGEMRAFNDTIHGEQEHLYRAHLTTVYDLMQMSLWGERDPDITFEFESLHELTPKEKSEVRKIDAETDQIRVDSMIVGTDEVRKKIAADPESGFHGLDPDDTPDLLGEELQGLVPPGSGKGLEAVLAAGGKKKPEEEETDGEDGGIQNFDEEGGGAGAPRPFAPRSRKRGG